jgi:hypothetical protein
MPLEDYRTTYRNYFAFTVAEFLKVIGDHASIIPVFGVPFSDYLWHAAFYFSDCSNALEIIIFGPQLPEIEEEWFIDAPHPRTNTLLFSRFC